MRDHATAESRLACGKTFVAIEQPDWTMELLTLLALALVIAWCVTAAQATIAIAERDIALRARDRAVEERDTWQQIALEEDKVPTVRVEPNGVGFRCRLFNVRREWEQAVAAKCQSMGALLQMARAAP